MALLGHRSLKRVSDTAVEGRFTCRIPGDSDSPRGLLILYPSESDMNGGVLYQRVSRLSICRDDTDAPIT